MSRSTKVCQKKSLFKFEYAGDGIISLSSKTYHCFGDHNKTSTIAKHTTKLMSEYLKKFWEQRKIRVGKISVSKSEIIGFTQRGSFMLTK